MSDKPIALVTGGAQGIGYASAEALAEDGHRPILADVREDGVREAAERLGNGAVGLICDMGEPAAVAALFDRIEIDYGPVATLVNNAGIALPGDFLSYDLDDFQRVIGVNLVGVFAATQRAARTMVEKGIRGNVYGRGTHLLRSSKSCGKKSVHSVTETGREEISVRVRQGMRMWRKPTCRRFMAKFLVVLAKTRNDLCGFLRLR